MKSKIVTIIVALIVIAFQIYLISVQPINAIVQNTYDDTLMIEQADSILKGQWLGEYNCLTLVKGSFTPVFMAAANILNIPFLIAQDIFYILACALLVYVLRKLIKNNIVRVIILSLLIFNPIIFSTELCRTYRDGIYLALIIYLLAFTFGIYIERKEKISKILWYYIGLGITIGSIYLCREEIVWIIPYLTVSLVITIYSIVKDKEVNEKAKKVLLYLVSIGIALIMLLAVMLLNYKYYKVFQLNQYWGREFKEAYGALTRILPKEEIRKVPVTSDMLEKADEISPKFRELKEYFNRETYNWAACGDGYVGEIQGGYFHWALMRAVEEKGYYKDAKTANEFYQELANEINQACDEGKVECLKNKRVSNVIIFDIQDLWKTFLKCGDTIKYQYRMVLVKVKATPNWIETEEDKAKLEKVREVTLTNEVTKDSYSSEIDKLRLNVIETIKNIESRINPFIFYESIVAFVLFIIVTIVNKQNKAEQFIVLIGLIGIYLCRIFIITFTSVTMYTSAINVLYLTITYVIQMIFSILSNVFLGQEIIRYINERNKNGANRTNNTNTMLK